MLYGRFIAGVAFAVTISMFLVQPLYAVSIETGSEKLAQYRTALKKAGEAQAKNDSNNAEQNMIAAEGFLQDARKAYDASDAIRSKDPSVLCDYAEVLKAQHDSDLAARALTRATQFDPENASLWISLGQALNDLGHSRAAEAQRVLRHALELDSKTVAAANTHVALGRLYRQEGLYDLARESYTKALERDPANIPAKLGIVILQVRDGKVREASETLDAMTAFPPEMTTMLEEALGQFDNSQKSITDDGPTNFAYARLLLRVNRIPESLTVAEHAARLTPNDYMIWNLLGDLSQGMNNPGRAREAYARSLQIKPDQPRTQERLNALGNDSPPSMLLR